MAFSRAAGKAKPAAQDPESVAWQAKLAEEQEERDRTQAKATEAAKNRELAKLAASHDTRWQDTQKAYASNLKQSAAGQTQIDEETARLQRIERSKAEAAKRAGGTSAGFGGAAPSAKSGFAWKKSPPASAGYSSGAQLPRANMGDLPSHDDCELAVSAMVSKTMQGMKEGLRGLGLPDYPLRFTPGKELKLSGHDVREGVNSMIHAWMTDEKDDFYDALLQVKAIVANPILTEDEQSLMQDQEAFAQAPSGAHFAQERAANFVGAAAKPKPAQGTAAAADDDSEDEVIDLSSAPAADQAPAKVMHSFAKAAPPVPVGAATAGDDHYELLGISATATLMEIRMKFRQLVVTEHPEKGGDPVKFAKLNKAYGVLSDQDKRKQYDEQRAK